MAISSLIQCEKCGEEKQESHSISQPPPNICSFCREIEKNKKKLDYLNNCSKFTIEERLYLIETQLYNIKQQKPLSYCDDLIG